MGVTSSVSCVKNSIEENVMLEIICGESSPVSEKRVFLSPEQNYELDHSDYTGIIYYNLYKLNGEGVPDEIQPCAQHCTFTNEKMIFIVQVSPGFIGFKSSFDYSERAVNRPCTRVENFTDQVVHVMVEDGAGNLSKFYLSPKSQGPFSSHVFRSLKSKIVSCSANFIDSPKEICELKIDNSKVLNYTCFAFLIYSSSAGNGMENNISLPKLAINKEYTHIRDFKFSEQFLDSPVFNANYLNDIERRGENLVHY
jgi:hypothetical protein